MEDSELFNEDLEIITLNDDETNEEINFAIIDKVKFGGFDFVLVIEASLLEDEEAEATILKKLTKNGEEYYEIIEDDLEFQTVADLFSQTGEEYDIEM